MADFPTKLCAAFRCYDKIPANRLMCDKHWSMVPYAIQKDIYDAYVPGQVILGNTSKEFNETVKEAMLAVREIENR